MNSIQIDSGTAVEKANLWGEIWNLVALKYRPWITVICSLCSSLPLSLKSILLSIYIQENELLLRLSTREGWPIVFVCVCTWSVCVCVFVNLSIYFAQLHPKRQTTRWSVRCREKITTPTDKHTLVSMQAYTQTQRDSVLHLNWSNAAVNFSIISVFCGGFFSLI